MLQQLFAAESTESDENLAFLSFCLTATPYLSAKVPFEPPQMLQLTPQWRKVKQIQPV